MYNIDQKILEAADKCDKNYECLTESDKPSCTICNCVNNQIHFLNKLERYCPYHLEFGYTHICTCPVRKEIYNKYGE